MIKSEYGRTEAHGSIPMLKADLACIVSSLNKELSKDLGAEEAKAEIMEAVNHGLMSEEERKAAFEDKTEKLEGVLHEAVDELIDKLLKGLVK